ncbi:hypothetical protein BVC93_10675 [Mycobacterium sp. MS1601]|nr:hypothetical protein BVC93_10675 [Mycobacterium sp. MS1601]
MTPLAIPANERAITIPNVSISDIQLTVTPAEIVAFFDNLQDELADFNAGIAELLGIPGVTLADGLQLAIDTNEEFFATLSGLTDNPNLIAILDALELGVNDGLESLQGAVIDANSNLVLTTRNLADLLTSTITGSLSNVLSTFVGVLNNPLDVSAYAAVLSTGVVGTGQLFASNGLSAIQEVGDSGFDFAWTGLDLADYQIYNALYTVGDLLDATSAATGSDLIVAINDAIQSITLAPAQAIRAVAFDTTFDVLDGAWTGFDQILGGLNNGYTYIDPETEEEIFVPGLVSIVGNSLRLAINVVGQAPLNPANYLEAGGVLIAGGFDGFNSSVRTVGNVAQIPFNVGIEITGDITQTITGLTLGFATALSDILTALGMPAEVANLPVALADGLNEVIAGGAAAFAGGLGIASALIEGGATTVINISNDIEQAIFGVITDPDPEEAAGATMLSAPGGASTQKVATEPSEDPAPVAEDNTEEETPAEDATDEEAPAEEDATEDEAEAPADDATEDDSEAPADDASADDDSDAKESPSSASEKTERGTKKAERDAEKAEKSDNSSSNSGGGSDSDSGSDSE